MFLTKIVEKIILDS